MLEIKENYKPFFIRPHFIMQLSSIDTRTHSMACHRKSLRSRRYLMVFDPLTLSQGHQFDPRVKIFSVSWSTAHPFQFDMPHDHVHKIKFLTPPAPSSPKPWGMHDPGDRMKIPSNMFYIFHL